MVTGVLLAMSAKKVQIEKNQIPSYTWTFIKKKINSFLPYYIFSLLFQLIFYICLTLKVSFVDIIRGFIKSIPRFLFFDCFGLRENTLYIHLSVDWYLSVMISAIIILLPLLLYNYEFTSKLICPLIAAVCLGYTFLQYGSVVVNSKETYTYIDPFLVRGVCNIALGVFGYEIALSIKEWKITKLSKILLTVLKWVCFFGVLFYAYNDFDKELTMLQITILLMGIVLSFSDNTYNIPYTSLTSFLGKLSLPLYLTHFCIRNICIYTIGRDTEKWIVWIIIILCPVFAYVVMVVTDFTVKIISKTKKLFVMSQGDSGKL